MDANQSPDFEGFNAYTQNPILMNITREAETDTRKDLARMGLWAGNADTIKLGTLANENEPQLNTHDAKGNRLDRVEFHPAWHALMRKGTEAGLHNSIWQEKPEEDGLRNQIRAARVFITAGVEMGHLCPLIMTNACVPVLKHSESVAREWMPKLLSSKYDPSHRPLDQKLGVTIGMGMTERQGGSDVRTNTSTAEKIDNGVWQINGQKWFFSAPMCDAFLVLAQMPEGPGCFLLPRILDGGQDNGLRFQRLKKKLGNKSNASSEVEFHDSLGVLLGEPGKGIKAIMDMVGLTRLDCAVASAGLMYTSVAEAVHHCRHRKAFGKVLVEQPLMARVLADLSLDVTAASVLAFRLAKAFDNAENDPAEAAYARLMTPVVKYWTCKIAPGLIYEAMECLGGNGYMETGNLARHYREAPLNAIWEGSGNIMCLDVLRAGIKKPDTLDAVLELLKSDLGGGSSAKLVDVIRSAAEMVEADEGSARILVEQLAYTAAAAELKRLEFGDVADAFMETRLGGLWRSTYGMLDNRHNANTILDASFPSLTA